MEDFNLNYSKNSNSDDEEDNSESSHTNILYIVMGVLILLSLGIGIAALIVALTKNGSTGPQGDPGPPGPTGPGGSAYDTENGDDGYINLNPDGYAILENLSNNIVNVEPQAKPPTGTINNSIILGNGTDNWQIGTGLIISNWGSTSDYSTSGVLNICTGCKSSKRTNCSTPCSPGDELYTTDSYPTSTNTVNIFTQSIDNQQSILLYRQKNGITIFKS
jgi:hypothetical protein